MKPPRLKDDCFALPPGIDWTPVDEAHDRLQAILHPVTETETLPLDRAAARFLAADAIAARANPPAANSAVDGYGFAHASTGKGLQILPLVPGRAAAGAPLGYPVPPGHAVRILTGAQLPQGIDTVVLQEDVTAEANRVAFHGTLKPGANTRRAGEDVTSGQTVVAKGTRLRPQELAILAATGLHSVRVHRRLRIGVLSTGDEVVPVGTPALDTQIYDANRPMLLSLAASWGYEPVDLGHVADDRKALETSLNQGAGRSDVILTSGGASSGDEDHVSSLLNATGTAKVWRIAIKPGRPLALGLWNGVPVFGLPGNPVAAFVCSLIFAEPAFRRLAGGAWQLPEGFEVPADFAKDKKPGRREYLRARLTRDGRAEVFRSEGSGRISGLAWAQGLVELGDGAQTIRPGDPVRYLPFSAFGT